MRKRGAFTRFWHALYLCVGGILSFWCVPVLAQIDTWGVDASPWSYKNHTIHPQEGYEVTARVLAVKAYSPRMGREGQVSPLDIVLAWGIMDDPKWDPYWTVRQSGRWYHFRWDDNTRMPPMRTVIGHTANTHMIPATDDAYRLLKDLQAGDRIRLRGSLVDVKGNDGWRWHTSMSRQDTGDGSCEILWVETVELLGRS